MSSRITVPSAWLAGFAMLASIVVATVSPAEAAGSVLYRVNGGGFPQTGTPAWQQDTPANPSAFVHFPDEQNNKATTTQDDTNPDATVPSDTNERIFNSHRHDPPGGVPAEMIWEFPVPNGATEVRLFFAETVFEAAGERVFDVSIEGQAVLDDFDIFAEVGHDVGTMRSFLVNVTDGTLEITFFHEVQHTMISGIEIIDWTGTPNLAFSPNPISLNALPNATATQTVDLENLGADDGAGPAVFVQGVTLSGDNLSLDFGGAGTWLAPGESLPMEVAYEAGANPDSSSGTLTASLQGGSSITAPVTGNTVTGISSLSTTPSSLVFPDTGVGTSVERDLTLSNTGSAGASTIDVMEAITQGTNPGSFEVTTPLPISIAPGDSAQLTVKFTPPTVGSLTATLRISHNGDNTPTAVDLTGSAVAAPAAEFTDIGESIFQDEIIWLAQQGITKGCNPPDNTLFCPTDEVTRGQMAAFLHRALEDILTPGEAVEFVDDDVSVFEADIEWLGATGVTRGCNPPANDEFCPDDPVTRGQMAAFLHRALDDVLNPGQITDFVDDNDSVFEADIEWLAATGVTRGCNPPANDQFCPTDSVTREQMAAFLFRALAG